MHLVTAVVTGCGLGLVLNLVIPVFTAEIDLAYRIGLIVWYATLGGSIEFLKHYLHHHSLHRHVIGNQQHMPDWLIAGVLGAWYNAMLLLFVSDEFLPSTSLAFNTDFGQAWFILEGTAAGMIISWASRPLSAHTGLH